MRRLPDEGKGEEQNLVLFLVKLMLATNVNHSLPILPDEGKVEEQNLVLFSETDAGNKCKSFPDWRGGGGSTNLICEVKMPSMWVFTQLLRLHTHTPTHTHTHTLPISSYNSPATKCSFQGI